MSFLLSAAALGFFSGGHCLGMCGPLVLALPVHDSRPFFSVAYRVVYNLGRVFTYAALGAAVGGAGLLFSLRGYQTRVSYIAGALLIVFAIVQLMPFLHLAFFSALHARIAGFFRGFIGKPGVMRFFALGSVNGFLPCGMVTSALAASLAAGDPAGSTLYMVFFGLGTFPVMLAASLFGIYLSPRLKKSLAVLGPLVSLALGILLLWRPALLIPHCQH
ncbi:MAG: sulfite exporter TauE/SafE family protein [Turneriella sp.]|nr:sulfite exporter TauE/SafE family protein [Turneriella sp.]